MPPQLHQSSLPILNPLLRFSPPSSPDNPKHQTESKIKMPKFTVRKLIPLLIFVLSSLSVLRLLRISYKSSSSASKSSSSTTFRLSPAESSQHLRANEGPSALTEKEQKFLSDTIARRSPCNVLVFGFAPQYLMLSSINTRGITVILDDEPAKIMIPKAKVNPNNTRIYSLKYHQMEVKNAYNLLRHARANPTCAPKMNNLQQGSPHCKMELKDLPLEVHNIKWDVIVVDGPRGDNLEAPGRMGSIYTAAALAREGSSNSTTDVLVHDVHRTAEKWLSWEFLCQENLVSAKGNFWKFRIKGQSNASRFCSPETVLIRY
ncbi:PREDICTED: probable methyltransferase At1g27930 [Camelina sativa]|uniref:Probable methyltransferase At1g27930 n=1 Tax=Camelina sativa TaxID=90675 RepID=A0ABM0TZL9_CAMSA|nr:PREDICTED: probable methyltransferase At1g27930 [Camelina sativa]